MEVLLDDLARLELDDASEYYELEVPGLGRQFREAVKRGIRRILEYPTAWPEEDEDVRRHLLHKFPYKILYSIEKDYIYIIAIAHCHRRPDYWIDTILNKS
ncbi:type II toxin-antitoxin system RelE/ParE family toxin [bacterium]|nr:type II toxin-antitoxin system RelE/ParE family toxin [bacterium]